MSGVISSNHCAIKSSSSFLLRYLGLHRNLYGSVFFHGGQQHKIFAAILASACRAAASALCFISEQSVVVDAFLELREQSLTEPVELVLHVRLLLPGLMNVFAWNCLRQTSFDNLVLFLFVVGISTIVAELLFILLIIIFLTKY